MNVDLLNMIEHFAKANKLKVRIAEGELHDRIAFTNDEDRTYYYRLDDGIKASEFPKIVQEVNEFFGLVKHDAEPLPVAKPTTVVEQHRTDICGLTKHEYMALELTKAWASTRSNSHWDVDDTARHYEEILKEVKARNL